MKYLKKVTLLSSIAATVLFVCPLTSNAASDGFYMGAFGGLNYTQSVSLNDWGYNYEGPGIKFQNPGYQLGGQIGYRSGAVRYEGEFLYLNPKPESYYLSTFDSTAKTGGNIKSGVGFANIYYDFDTGMTIKPYVGAGIGASLSHSTYSLQVNRNNMPTLNWKSSNDNLGFAAQGIAGVIANVSDNVDLFADYRYVDLHVSGVHDRLKNHTFNVGLNIKLG